MYSGSLSSLYSGNTPLNMVYNESRRGVAAAPVMILQDLFNGANNTLLGNHTADSGHTWETCNYSSSGWELALYSNAVQNYAPNSLTWSASRIASGWVEPAHYTLESTFYRWGSGKFVAGILARAQVALQAATYVEFELYGDSTYWSAPAARLLVWNAGTVIYNSGLTTVPDKSVAAETYNMKLEVDGDTFTAYVDGVQYFQVTDSTLAAGTGSPGIRHGRHAANADSYALGIQDITGWEIP